MASIKDKTEILDAWSPYFPLHHKWKDQFLIRRHGGLLSGVCLDATRDPKTYKPTFFFHNLLVPSRVVTLSYAAPLLSNGVYKPLKYGVLAKADVEEFKRQISLSHEDVTFEKFVRHIVDAQHGRYGSQAIYLPHTLRDIITVGSYAGDKFYYSATLDKCAASLSAKSGINLAIIGSVGQWIKTVSELIQQDSESVIHKELERHGLQMLPDSGMPYSRVERFWERLS